MKTINKTKNIALLAGICAAVLLAAGCKNDAEVDGGGGEPVLPTPQETLVGKWKLAGIVNAETGEIKELEPKDCEECYTLTIDTNYEATVRRINYTHKLNLLDLKPELLFDEMLRSEKYEKDGKYYNDVDIFYRVICAVKSYAEMEKELKLISFHPYFGDTYLLFKPFKTIQL